MARATNPLTQRRLRANEHIRSLVASVRLSHQVFIQPLFIEEGLQEKRVLEGMDDLYVDTIHTIESTIAADIASGITKFLLFPIPSVQKKDSFDFSFVAEAIKQIKKQFGGSIWLAADVCLCSYTPHGHCGILSADQQQVLNAETVEVLASYALELAKAGVDCIAPSDMMDGRIAGIRNTLNKEQYDSVSIMSYAAKFSSQFYGPFRDACHSAPKGSKLNNRKTYQMSPANPGDAIRSALRDEAEGADILMVKPAATYTDIIRLLSDATSAPIAAYHVSGEYAAIEALAKLGLADREAAHVEVWTALQRSGAGIIISYAARYAKKWIEKIEW